MSQPTPTQSESPLSWQEKRYRWAAIPGWGLSLILHALFLVLISTQLKSCGGVITGTGEGEYRSVGLVMKDSDSPNFNDNTQHNDSEVDQKNEVTDETEVLEVPENPPVEMALPEMGSNLLGPGALAPAIGLPNPTPSKIQSASSSIPLPAAFGQGDGPVRFLGAIDAGKNFVYIIDCSGSMGDYNALDYAKAELLASLQGVSNRQKFQIIFYNEEIRRFQLPNQAVELYPGIDVNRNRAKRFIGSVSPSLGTKHMPALLAALKYEPDVIFFLTDAREPALSKDGLLKVKKANYNSARVHCIEFGVGHELPGDNFLKRLARQNKGTYSYRDVTKLGGSR
jgi:Ca-activated chloride channel family protein